jgi:hypothetical protein
MQTPWEPDLANLLSQLSAVQDRSLEILTRKRELLVEGNAQGLAALEKEEEQVIQELQDCLGRRETLLQKASQEGLPCDSIQSLVKALPDGDTELPDRVRHAASQSRLLRHHSLTNWVLVQRTLLHLSQMLEIVATGGKLQPTYGKDQPADRCGALVDQEV